MTPAPPGKARCRADADRPTAACPGRMIVLRTESEAPIRWQCSVCDDDRRDQQLGGLAVRSAPPTAHPRRARQRDRHRRRGRGSTARSAAAGPDCERLVFRIRAHTDGAVLSATDDDLDELIGSVAAEANHEPNRRRQQRLDAAFDALNNAASSRRPVIRWPYQTWTSHECNAGAPLGCPSTPATKSASNARSPRDTSRSSSGALPGARTSARSGPASRSPGCATPPPTSPGPSYWRDRNLRFHLYDPLAPSTPSRGPAHRARPRPHLHLLGLTQQAKAPDAAQLGPATSVTVGPSWVDIATAGSGFDQPGAASDHAVKLNLD